MRTALSILTVLSVLAFPAYANTIETDSDITAATVYSGRATITRTAIVNVPAGAHEIQLTGLPIGLFPDSLRVEGTGNAAVTLGALSHKLVNSADLVIPREKEINDQIKVLQDRQLIIGAEMTALAKQKEFYDSLMAKASERTREEIADFNLKPDQWASAAKTVTDGYGEAEKNTILKQIELADIEQQIVKLRQDLDQIRTGGKQTYTVSLPVEAARGANLTLELSYQMGNAGWRPVYDARLNTKTGKLELVQYGAVSQRTGEDWTDIALTLSTARPHRGASLPDLSAMWVNIAQHAMREMKAMSRQSFSAGAAMEMAAPAALMDEAESDMATAPQPARMIAAQIDTGGFTAEYKIVGPSDVLADGTESKLLVGSFDTDSVLEIHVKPQVSADAYLATKTMLKGEAPILPGTVSLFRDGAYVGQSSLPLLRPGKDTALYFGIDDQVEVTRNTLKDEGGETGLLGRDNNKERQVITGINNLRSAPVKLVVQETVPVSKDEKIEAKILPDATTPGYEKDTDNIKGLLTWRSELPAKTKTDIKLGWTVSWPKDTQIIGLPN